MSTEREVQSLVDILENIDRITDYLGNASRDEFAGDRKTIDAVERCLQRITEATIRIGAARLEAISPSTLAHEARGLGNVLRHAYDMIDLDTIWLTVKEKLPVLRADCAAALNQ